jgi:hypothetical protein
MTAGLLMLRALAWVSPALSATTAGTASYERTVDRWYRYCDDGTRAISRYNTALDCWETAVTESPCKACRGKMNPRTNIVARGMLSV